jgi:hypothetical protein
MAFHTFIFHRKESMEISLYFISFTENIDFLTIFYFIVLYLSYIFNTGTWSEACIIELLILLLSVLITFCLFFEFARNSSFFYLKRICSINNTLLKSKRSIVFFFFFFFFFFFVIVYKLIQSTQYFCVCACAE